jgi:hypothetical protein
MANQPRFGNELIPLVFLHVRSEMVRLQQRGEIPHDQISQGHECGEQRRQSQRFRRFRPFNLQLELSLSLHLLGPQPGLLLRVRPQLGLCRSLLQRLRRGCHRRIEAILSVCLSVRKSSEFLRSRSGHRLQTALLFFSSRLKHIATQSLVRLEVSMADALDAAAVRDSPDMPEPGTAVTDPYSSAIGTDVADHDPHRRWTAEGALEVERRLRTWEDHGTVHWNVVVVPLQNATTAGILQAVSVGNAELARIRAREALIRRRTRAFMRPMEATGTVGLRCKVYARSLLGERVRLPDVLYNLQGLDLAVSTHMLKAAVEGVRASGTTQHPWWCSKMPVEMRCMCKMLEMPETLLEPKQQLEKPAVVDLVAEELEESEQTPESTASESAAVLEQRSSSRPRGTASAAVPEQQPLPPLQKRGRSSLKQQ